MSKFAMLYPDCIAIKKRKRLTINVNLFSN